MGPRLSRQAIIDAARALLVAGGIEAVSLRRVAAALGVTAPALYAHVSDKSDLLRALAEQEAQRMIERFEALTETDPLDRMRAQSLAYVAYAKENPAVFKALFLVVPDITEEAGAVATRALEAASACVFDASRAGLLGAIDPRLAALALWTASHGVATVILSGTEFDPELEHALVETVIDSVITGLGGRRP